MLCSLPLCKSGFDYSDEPKRSKKQTEPHPAQPLPPTAPPDPSQPSGTSPAELAKQLEGVVYEDFDPLLLKQNESLQKLEFDTYDAALDEFYAKVSNHVHFVLPMTLTCMCIR